MISKSNNANRISINLNGIWEIEPGGKDNPPTEFTHRIQVPSLVDCAEPSYDWQSQDFHWYRKRFHADENQIGRPAFLRIEQSMFGTAVWVNGSYAGESISCYTSQEYRIDSFLEYKAENEIIVRIGQRATLPPESAVGKDQERLSFIPGIWGDVELIFTGEVRVKLVQILPRLDNSSVDVNIWIENLADVARDVVLTGQVFEKISSSASSGIVSDRITLAPASELKFSLSIPVVNPMLWSPESPFLYVFTANIQTSDGNLLDKTETDFGMREFKIDGTNFYLNGKKIFLRGSNIAFHRFLSDYDRRLLPWNEDWIRRVLIEIPKEHNFNFFRAHLGHMYNLWYDIADEAGMLIQDEWQFWGATGTKAQITKEFSDWLKDNWNHPGIVIWDALNESSDEVVQNEIIPGMKKLDPTRPWESHDFFEDHPYIYSLGPVLVDRKFGYTRSLSDIERSSFPSQVNEYLWWWLDKDFVPSELTKKVVRRWLGESYTQDELVERQSFLASELTELFRRLGVKCIQPFVYLSANDGPTSHWFTGDIAELTPKPVLDVLKSAFEPLGVSVELWDRHFYAGEKRDMTVFVFNDYPSEKMGTLDFGIKDSSRNWISSSKLTFTVPPSENTKENVTVSFPDLPGDYYVSAEVTDADNGRKSSSMKIAHVYSNAIVDKSLAGTRIGVADGSGEITEYLNSAGVIAEQLKASDISSLDVILLSGGVLDSLEHEQRGITGWINRGGRLIIIEPERGICERTKLSLPGIKLIIEPRADADQGGYDSYVFADDYSHPIWKGIRKEDMQMFNGAFGGEMVPQMDLTIEGKHAVLARSGLNLARPVVVEAKSGDGLVIISSIEISGRLIASADSYANLYARRPDPVARRLLLNLIAYASSGKRQTSKHE